MDTTNTTTTTTAINTTTTTTTITNTTLFQKTARSYVEANNCPYSQQQQQQQQPPLLLDETLLIEEDEVSSSGATSSTRCRFHPHPLPSQDDDDDNNNNNNDDDESSTTPSVTIPSQQQQPLPATTTATATATATTTLPQSTMFDRIRFSSGIAGYRIVRLSVELFLILHIKQLNYPIKRAGLIYLLYSIASILSGLVFLIFPTICFGSYLKSITFFTVSVMFMIGGFIMMFLIQSSFGYMVFFAMMCGCGSASFNINYQSLTNVSFPKHILGSIAFLRQLFECIGFLLPSICLAIILTSNDNDNDNNDNNDNDNNDNDNDNYRNKNLSLISFCVIILGIIAFCFTLLSMDRMVYSASKVSPQDIIIFEMQHQQEQQQQQQQQQQQDRRRDEDEDEEVQNNDIEQEEEEGQEQQEEHDEEVEIKEQQATSSSSSEHHSTTTTSHKKRRQCRVVVVVVLSEIKVAFQEFFGTSVVKYFLLNSILLSASNILLADMSLITEYYFGIDPIYLWIGAIGFPIGGILSVGYRTIFIKKKKNNAAASTTTTTSSPTTNNNDHNDDDDGGGGGGGGGGEIQNRNSKTGLLVGTFQLGCLFSLCIILTPWVPPAKTNVAKAMLFLFGLVSGNIYSVTYASSLELWLLKLKEYPINFVSRAAVINNLGVQAIIAFVFQIQTLLVDTILTPEEDSSDDDDGRAIDAAAAGGGTDYNDASVTASWDESIVFFGPLLVLLSMAWIITRSIPD